MPNWIALAANIPILVITQANNTELGKSDKDVFRLEGNASTAASTKINEKIRVNTSIKRESCNIRYLVTYTSARKPYSGNNNRETPILTFKEIVMRKECVLLMSQLGTSKVMRM